MKALIGTSRRKQLGWAAAAGIAGALASCQMDERTVALPFSLAPAPGEVPGDGDGLPGGLRLGPEGAELEYGPAQLELGSVVLGYPAFGRLHLSNGGSTPSAVPAISLASGGSVDFAIAQNLCGGTLAPSSSCDVRVQVVPSIAGDILAALQLSDAAGNVTTVPLVARGVSRGELALRPAEGDGVDFGGVLVGSPSESRFRVTNPVAASSGALSFSLANPDFQLVAPLAGECQAGASLAGGGSCDLRLAYTPSSRGRQDATLTISSVDLGSQSLGLVGRGLVPGAFASTPAAQDFQGVMLGGVGTATLQVRNGGDLPITLAGVALGQGAPDDFAISSAQCGAGDTLSGGDAPASCALDLEFRPGSIGDFAAELVLTSDGGVETRVPLAGRGLLPGTLRVAPAAGSLADYGDVLVGESRTQAFNVSNPSAEPSGTFTIEAGGNFQALAGAGPGECQPGVTTLVNDESCTVNVALAPALRAAQSGSLTVESQLAGSASVPLTGRGILPAVLAPVQTEVNFGRVVLGRASQGSLSVRNDGDAPLAPPALAVASAVSGVPADFTWTSSCQEALPPAGQCEIALTLLATAVGPYSATLTLTSADGGAADVLLLAEAIEPGSLLLAADAGSSADFGDTAVNVAVTRGFTLTNPGGEPSGPLSISANDTHFVVDAGACGAGIGIANGESCGFSVTFTPDSSLPLTANLSAESITAGIASLSLSGRGRIPATLAGTNEFNFNTVVTSQSSAARPWTVTNSGDLPTGLLVTTGASAEFVVAADTCNGQSLAPAAACSMTVTFAPQSTGLRQAQIAVTDSAAGGSVSTLALSGIGQPLPGVGEVCLAGACATGATCENHSNGLAQVCCGTDCTGNQRCSEAQDFLACELPTVGAGARCVAGTNVCAGGLTCGDPARPGFCCPTDCSGPCQACSEAGTCAPLPDQQKGGCGGNKVCVGGACSCSGLDRQSLDCGGDRCIRDVADACCDSAGCVGADVCGTNNLCGCPAGSRECTPGGNDCVPNDQCCNCGGLCQTCNNGLCGSVPTGQPGRCPTGQECNAGGGCVPSVAPASLATVEAPIPATVAVIQAGASLFRTWEIVNNGGQATPPLTLGALSNEFSVTGPCIGASLASGATCVLEIVFTPARPARTQTTTLTMSAGSLSVSTTLGPMSIRVGPAGDCTVGALDECAITLTCQTWFLDQDRDGYGGEVRLGGAPSKSVCSNDSPSTAPPDVPVSTGFEVPMPYVRVAGDCCDFPGDQLSSGISIASSGVNPGVTTRDIRPAPACALPDDLNCDGVEDCASVPAQDGTTCI